MNFFRTIAYGFLRLWNNPMFAPLFRFTVWSVWSRLGVSDFVWNRI